MSNLFIDLFREDFKEIVPLPDKLTLAREIRFYQYLFQSHRLLQSAKFLGELLLTLPSSTT